MHLGNHERHSRIHALDDARLERRRLERRQPLLHFLLSNPLQGHGELEADNADDAFRIRYLTQINAFFRLGVVKG